MIYDICCVSKKLELIEGKLVPYLELIGQIYPEAGLTFDISKCSILASVILFYVIVIEDLD